MSSVVRRGWLAVCGGLSIAVANAQPDDEEAPDDAPPDTEFLEYLGAWQDSDEEWEIVSEWSGAATPAPGDDGFADEDTDRDE